MAGEGSENMFFCLILRGPHLGEMGNTIGVSDHILNLALKKENKIKIPTFTFKVLKSFCIFPSFFFLLISSLKFIVIFKLTPT